MIRRRDNPQWIIPQTAHSWLAGQLAMHWGNDDFQFCGAAHVIMLAAANHDLGWTAWEQAPRLDAQGRPLDFLEMPVETHLHLWRESIHLMSVQDKYAALLVSKHACDLVEKRLFRQEDSEPDGDRLQAFLVGQGQWQEDFCRVLDSDPLWKAACRPVHLQTNVRLLQIFDWLSLLLCMFAPEETEIPDVPGHIGDVGRTLRLKPENDRTITVSPWPFNCPRFAVRVQYVPLPEPVFANEKAFQMAWKGSPARWLRFEFAA